jgi:hypothetical protein
MGVHLMVMRGQHRFFVRLSPCSSVMLMFLTIPWVSGCVLHNVKYTAFIKNNFQPSDHAMAVTGSIDQAKALTEQARLPHNSARQRFELEREAGRVLRAQLGSQDYVAIGEVYGCGNAYSNLETLKSALCKKAAAKGGDVVLVFNAGLAERPFAYSTPGYATTDVYGSTYRVGNYAYGNATAYTTFSPGQTYYGVMRFPHANALVLKYVPGIEGRREAAAALGDTGLEWILGELEKLRTDKSLSFEECLERWDEMIAEARER